MIKLLVSLAVIIILVGFGLWTKEADTVPVETAQPESVVVEATATSSLVEVSFVIDGDTIEIAGGERVRLLGIDTPEIGECYYQQATDFARELVAGESVRLVADETDRDKYGRLLRHVFVTSESGEEVHVNYALLQGGYAELLPIPPDRAYREEFKEAEVSAKASGVGRWGTCE